MMCRLLFRMSGETEMVMKMLWEYPRSLIFFNELIQLNFSLFQSGPSINGYPPIETMSLIKSVVVLSWANKKFKRLLKRFYSPLG